MFYIELQSAESCFLPCAQGRVGVGLHRLAAMPANASSSFRRRPESSSNMRPKDTSFFMPNAPHGVFKLDSGLRRNDEIKHFARWNNFTSALPCTRGGSDFQQDRSFQHPQQVRRARGSFART